MLLRCPRPARAYRASYWTDKHAHRCHALCAGAGIISSMHAGLANHVAAKTAVAAKTHRRAHAVQPDMLMTLGDESPPDQDGQEDQAIGPFP